MCDFPLCKYPALREGFCVHHAKHFASPKMKAAPKPIPAKSKKRIAEDKVYKKIVAEMKEISDRCEIKSPVCTGEMQGLHHIVKRSPKNLCDRNNVLKSCNPCNSHLESNDKWARENGFVKSKFKI